MKISHFENGSILRQSTIKFDQADFNDRCSLDSSKQKLHKLVFCTKNRVSNMKLQKHFPFLKV